MVMQSRASDNMEHVKAFILTADILKILRFRQNSSGPFDRTKLTNAVKTILVNSITS